MAEVGTGKRSFLAFLLSLVFPGLGQLYLRKPGKTFVILLGVSVGLGLVYVNSFPVTTWEDMRPQIEANDKKKTEEHTVWQFEDGRQLRFRPRRAFQLSGWVQVIVFWLFGAVDGWQGRRGYRRPKKPRTAGQIE